MGVPYDFRDVEARALKLWEDNQIYPKVKEKNKGRPKFYFLQGPPYTSGKPHIGHAWNNTMKDWVLRYKRMRGFDVWDRAGYDMHGLPTANAVMKKLGLLTKDDIEKYGVDKFVKECIKFSTGGVEMWNREIRRLGVWMDFENAYLPVRPEFIEGVWWVMKKAHSENRLYKGKKVMTWCYDCETGLSKHELEYKEVKDNSIFLKFKLKGTNEYLIVWTTTPWTIPFNMAVMVNPDLVYQKCKVGGEVWIIAKALASLAIANITGKPFEVVEELKGKDLEGQKYEHPLLDKIPAFKKFENVKKLHSVILSAKYVDAGAGSGLVHCAPGCGPEDQEVGAENGIPPFNNLDGRGIFQDMGEYTGRQAKVDDKFFIEELKKSGSLIHVAPVDHEYPHCWRCGNPVVFRLTEQWFLKVEDLTKELVDQNKAIKWVPKSAGARYVAWISNLRDNSIARQRFWGTPVPIWECECGRVKVIESREELKKEGAKSVPDDLHRPWIDEVTLPCDCGKELKRVPDVLDVWIDSGTVSWNCLDFPHRKDLLDKYYPADFIIEATEQARLWFSMLNIYGTLAFGKPAFKAVYNHGMILDYEGVKMSKSKGNVISPYEVIDKVGVDVMRFYFGTTPAGQNITFSWDEAKNEQRNLRVLWNLHNFLIDLAKDVGVNPAELKKEGLELSVEEEYMLSKLQKAAEEATYLFESYQLDKVPFVVRDLWLELSRVYIQFVRDKAAVGTEDERLAVVFTVYRSLLESVRMLSPICPFITEIIYQNMAEAFRLNRESIHMFSWPKPDASLRNEGLEHEMGHTLSVITGILAARDIAKISVRWPVLRALVVGSDRESVEKMKDVIKVQCNVKDVVCVDNVEGLRQEVKLNVAAVGKSFGSLAPKITEAFGKVKGEDVVEKLRTGLKFQLKLEDITVDLLPEHVQVNRVVPEPFVEASFPGGLVYLDTTSNPELEAEGFAREITRKLQSMRKKAGLVKADRINAVIIVAEPLVKALSSHVGRIKERCGVDLLTVTDKQPDTKFHIEEFKVKEILVKVGLIK